MPRFYFDVTTDGSVSRDLEGTELPDATTARAEAAQCFGEMIRNSGLLLNQWGMAVSDERGLPIATASFHMKVAAPE